MSLMDFVRKYFYQRKDKGFTGYPHFRLIE